MKTVFTALVLSIAMFIFAGCALTDKDYPFQEDYVLVSSCPSDILVTVNEVECVTPCKLKFPNDTSKLVVTYDNKSTVVPTGQSGLYKHYLQGSLVIMDPEKIGGRSDAMDTTYFLRDYSVGISDPCSGK